MKGKVKQRDDNLSADAALAAERRAVVELTRANERLEEYNRVLEQKVEQCTVELQKANQRLKALNERIQNELAVAHEVQQGLLPPPRPEWDDPEVVCYCAPAREVGGDFYAYYTFDTRFRVSKERFALAVGDVSGKGMPAALLMAISLASFESVITRTYSLNKLITDSISAYSLNRFLTELDKALAPYTATTRQNCALVYVELTKPAEPPQPTTLRAVNAGCIMPLIRRGDGTVEWVDVGGLPLGVSLGAEYEYKEVTRDLMKGDLVILISDGVVEANNAAGEMFSFDRLEHAVAAGPTTSAEAMLAHLRAEVAAFVGAEEPHDDLTMVIVKV